MEAVVELSKYVEAFIPDRQIYCRCVDNYLKVKEYIEKRKYAEPN